MTGREPNLSHIFKCKANPQRNNWWLLPLNLKILLFTSTLRGEKMGMNAEDGSTCMCLRFFWVTEENTCLMLCIATGKIADNFFITANRNSPKNGRQFFKEFSLMQTKTVRKTFSKYAIMSPCTSVSAIG